MTARIRKRSVCIKGQKTSLSIEGPFYVLLREMATAQQVSISKMVEQILEKYEGTDARNTSSKVRLAVLEFALQKNIGQPSQSEINGHLGRLKQHLPAQASD